MQVDYVTGVSLMAEPRDKRLPIAAAAQYWNAALTGGLSKHNSLGLHPGVTGLLHNPLHNGR